MNTHYTRTLLQCCYLPTQPGTLIEWGQAWEAGLRYRGNDEAVAGWFTQIGLIHQVYHLWGMCGHVIPHV